MPKIDISDYTKREVHLLRLCEELHRALKELTEQVDSLEDYRLSRDLVPYKAQACWDYAIHNAHETLEGKGKLDA